MKRVLTLLVFALISTTNIYAQKEIKPKLSKIESLYKKGELVEAKEISDVSISYEKTMNDPKTWYLRGLIYMALDTSASMVGVTNDALKTSVSSFIKSDALIEDKSNELFIMDDFGYPTTKTQQIESYWGFYYNKAAAAFGEKDFVEAITSFNNAALIKPNDTNSVINSGYAAVQANLYDQAKNSFYKAIELGSTDKDVRLILIYVVSTGQKLLEESLEIIRDARVLYPSDNELARQEINILIQLDKSEEATINLVKAIEAEPDDPNLHFTLGILHEEIGLKLDSEAEKSERIELARKAYTAAIDADPNYYNGHYNLGVLAMTEVNIYIKEQNSLGYSKVDLKKSEELEPIIQEKLSLALPLWEKTVLLKDDEIPALETLAYLYTMKKMYDEAESIQAKIDALK
jgi:tetratricopeptide (TPR) repeat protein